MYHPLILSLLLSLLTWSKGISQDTVNHAKPDTAYLSKPPISIYRLSNGFKFDGFTNDSCWLNIPSLPFFTYLPVWGQPMSEKTELRIAYDDKFIYIAGNCYTSNTANIIGRTLVRDGWRGDDFFTIHFDSRFDKQNALVFSIYPTGARYDMSTSNDAIELGSSTFNSNLNMIWDAKTTITDKGWFFEMKIPLFNLRYSFNDDGKVNMGLSAFRAIQSKQEYHHFPAIPPNIQDAEMKPSLKQPIVFNKLKKHNLFLISPFLSHNTNQTNLFNNNDYTGRIVTNQLNFGIDFKKSISTKLTLDATIKPDFGQAEADQQQVNLSRFSLFFPEKRAFFQEQAGVFEFVMGNGDQLFYSRRIGLNNGYIIPILGGLRVTGKIGSKVDIGILNMQSQNFTTPDSINNKPENYGVFRVRRTILNNRSFIGGLFTSKISQTTQAFSGGVDGLINLKQNHYIKFSASVTNNNLSSTSQLFQKSRLYFEYENRKRMGLIPKLGYVFSGDNFNPDLGFISRPNIHNLYGSLDYTHFANSSKKYFQAQNITIGRFDAYWNTSTGYLESLEYGIGWRANTFKGFNTSLQLVNNFEYVADSLNLGNTITIKNGSYNSPSVWLFITPPRYKSIRLPITLAYGKFYDGNKAYLSLNPTLNFGRHLEIVPGYEFNRLSSFENKSINIHVARLKIDYAYNLHLSANFTTQYVSASNKLFINVRARYNFKDGNDFFLIFNNVSKANNVFKSNLVSAEQFNIMAKYVYTFSG